MMIVVVMIKCKINLWLKSVYIPLNVAVLNGHATFLLHWYTLQSGSKFI